MKIFLLLCLLLGVCSSARSQPAEEARHEVANYNSMQARYHALYAWPGRRVVVLTSSGTLDETVMKRIVEAFDKSWEFLADVTGREPLRDGRNTWRGLATIAVVPETCGETCAQAGRAGLEMRADAWEAFYLGVRDKSEFVDTIFFQMGIAFWFYNEQTIGVEAIKIGFGIWARFATMEAAGIKGAPFRNRPFDEFRREVESLIDLYYADASLNFGNTILEGRAPANAMGLGATDLFASFVFRLNKSGDKEFRRQLWREMALRPKARSREESADNLLLAASAASGQSQAELFEKWRWPVSPGAKQESEAMFMREELGGTGLRGEYFRGEFAESLLKRVDSQLNFEWSDGPPFEKGPVDSFSVRWSGEIMARQGGLYTMSVDVDDGARLWVDGRLVVDQWQDHVGEDSGQVMLPAMRRVAIRVEYREAAVGARLKLLWSGPKVHRQIVPQDNLFSE